MFIEMLQRLRPVRGLPIWARWLLTVVLVFGFFAVRLTLGDGFGRYPFLLFFPPVILASFIFDRGSGVLAVLLSAVLSLYFFIEPGGASGAFRASDVAALGLYIAVGLLLAGMMEALRHTVEQLTERTAELEREHAEAERSRRLLEGVIQGTPDVVFVKDREGRIVLANDALVYITGVPRAAIIGRRDADFLPAEQAAAIHAADQAVMRAAKTEVVQETVDTMDAASGRRVPRLYVSAKTPWLDAQGNVIGLIGIARDVTEQQAAADALRLADRQKQLLLTDINHRIKNHLQSVSAFAEMAGRRLGTVEDGRAALSDMAGRLHVLAQVYDRLQVRDSETSVRADGFLEQLCADLKASLVELRPISLRVHAEPIELDPTQAANVGLIVNELLQNALKHAFPDDRAGDVRVSLTRDDGHCVLVVADNGVGRAPNRSDTAGGGTGSRLLRALAQQLGGALQWHDGEGATATLRFPAVEPNRVMS